MDSSKYKVVNNILYKRCSRHKEYFPIENEWLPCTEEYFYKNKSSPDGLFPYCKRCNIEKARVAQYKKYHNGDLKLYYDKRYLNKKEEILQKQKEYNKKEHRKARRKEYSKEWRKEHPNRLKQYIEKYSNKKHTISSKEWKSCKEYFNNKCAYCGLPLEKHKEIFNTDFHKEHVYYNGRNDLKNCIPSCKSCNTSKHQSSLNDWYNKNNPVYTYERYYKIYKWIRFDCKKYIKKKKVKLKKNNNEK